MVDIKDIAFHLARIRRFNGAAKANCSVALHSIIVSHLVPEEYAQAALLHDAHEAYIGDISTPVKMMLGEDFRDLNRRIKSVIWNKFKYERELDGILAIKEADLQSLKYERDYFMPKTDRPWEVLEGIECPKSFPSYIRYYINDDPDLHERLFIDRSRELGLL